MRPTRRRWTVAAALLALVALAVAGWRAGPGQPSGAGEGAGREPGRGAGGAGPANGPGDEPVPDHVLNDTEHGAGGGDDVPVALTWYRQLSTLPLDDVTRLVAEGVGSDLPAETRRSAAEVAAAFVVADLSGEGRDRFPTWWGGEAATAAPARACCRDVAVLAAGAGSYPAEEGLVLALVVWSATPVDGVTRLDAWEASFVFLRSTPGGGAVPVDPSTVASWQAPPGLGQPVG